MPAHRCRPPRTYDELKDAIVARLPGAVAAAAAHRALRARAPARPGARHRGRGRRGRSACSPRPDPLRQRARLRRLLRHAARVPRRAWSSAPGSYRERIASLRARGKGARDDPRRSVLHHFVADAIAELEQLEEDVSAADLRAAVKLLAGAPDHPRARRSGASFPVACYLAYALGQLELRAQLLDGVGGMLARARAHDRPEATCCWWSSFRNYSPEVVEIAQACHAPRRAGDRDHRQRALAARRAPPPSASSSATTRRRPFRSLVAPLCLAQALVVSVGHHCSPNGTAPPGGPRERPGSATGPFDVDLHGPRRGRPVRRADRRPAGGHADLRQVPRRLAGQHRGRRGAPRPAGRRCSRASATSTTAASCARRSRAEGVDVSHVAHRPEAAHRARLPRHPRPRHLPARLLPRQLRRHGARARTTSTRRSSRSAQRAAGLGHAPVAAADLERLPARRCARARAARHARRARHRLPAGAVGPDRARPGRAALRRLRPRSARSCRRSLPHVRPASSAPRRRSTSPAAATDTLAALRRMRALTPATARDEARADGLRRLRRRDPRRRSTTASHGPGFPVEVFNVLGAGDAFMAGFLRGWLRDEPLERLRCATPMPAARSSCRATAARRRCRAGTELDALPRARLRRRRAARGRRARAPAPRDHAPQPLARSSLVLAFDHRAQLEELADAARRAARAHRATSSALVAEARRARRRGTAPRRRA